jgi:hypothetical protein
MLKQLLDSLLFRLRSYFDLEKMGLLLGEFLVSVIIAVIVLALFTSPGGSSAGSWRRA